jgi:regulatory protein
VNDMAIITKITTQQKNQDRFNIFMDYGKGEEFAFSVDSDVLIKFQLKKGMELEEFSLMEIHYHDDVRKAYNLAINYLSKRMRSEKEVKDYLKLKEVEDPVIHEVIHKLKTQKYINDLEYALAYVRTQANTTDKGLDLVRIDLKEKGISEEKVNTALMEYPKELQIEKAVKLAEKFFAKNSRDSKRILKQKLENLLLRKGYSYEIINIAENEADLTKDSAEEMDAIRYQGEKIQRKYSKFEGFEYQQKMKQALYQKGFPFDLIEKYLAEVKNHDE